jgi:hypothetical protein
MLLVAVSEVLRLWEMLLLFVEFFGLVCAWRSMQEM